MSEASIATRMVGAFGPNGELRFIASLDDAEKAAMFRERQADRIEGIPSRYAVVLRDGESFIGSIGSYEVDEGRIGLSYWIGTPYHGSGFATEALCAYCGPALRLLPARSLAITSRLKLPNVLSAITY